MKKINCPCGFGASWPSFALVSFIHALWKCPRCGRCFIIPDTSLVEIVTCPN